MGLTNEQLKVIMNYKEKSFISSVMCHNAANHYSYIKMIVNIPLILFSCALTVLNSSFDAELMKFPNICINILTALILSLIGNFKINEKEVLFSQNKKKFSALHNEIQDLIVNNLNNLDSDNIKYVVTKYEAIEMSFDYPEYIKNRIKKKYRNRLNTDYSAELAFFEDSPQTSKTTTPKVHSITSKHNNSDKNIVISDA